MKLRIITFNRAYNYGAVLQCYALSSVIRELGYECEVLDYYPEIFRKTYEMLASDVSFVSRIKHDLKRLVVLPVLKKRNNNFDSFIRSYIPISERQYLNTEEVNGIQSDTDVYITGSDQVWSNIWADFDPVFFLDFPDANSKIKVSYAASFGFDRFPETLLEEYRSRLKDYRKFSVREESAVSLVENLCKKRALLHCDPTMLVAREKWSSLIEKRRLVRKPYILIYYTAKSHVLYEFAYELQKKFGLDIIALPCLMDFSVMSGIYDSKNKARSFPYAGPKEFLNLFWNAEYVLTNTFHGTVFSIIFRKKFATQMYRNNKLNYRVDDLFKHLNIERRLEKMGIDEIEIEPYWDDIDSRIKELQSEAKSYLNSIGTLGCQI